MSACNANILFEDSEAALAEDESRARQAAERFGEALRSYRRAAGLTQEELAEHAGISPRSVSGMERGEGSTPRRDTVALLVKALELSATERAAFEALLFRQRPPRPRLLPVPGLPAAQRKQHGPQHNLPRSLDSFVGRESELRDLGATLATAPLTTLLGAGGIGKSRLARELVLGHLEDFDDGAWLVELAEINEAAQLAGAVAAAVGLRDFHARDTGQVLTTYLRQKHLLLILDNCEHLVEACAALLGALLRECPCMHVLTTSREPLGIKGEIVWPVRPLKLPRPDLGLNAEEVTRVAAARLFAERARAVNANFVPTDQNATAIARVCLAVDGIPLALELAAARTRLLSIDELANRLEQDVHILRGSSRNGSPRHETIRATIDWSHDLLDEREQVLLRRVAVFAGGWTLDMAEDVCSGPDLDRADVLDTLSQLVDKSMVLANASDSVARYHLLGPIRQYAEERLRSAGEEDVYAARHAAVMLSLPRPGEVDDFGPAEVASLDRFEMEHANLRAGLRWGLDHGHNDAVLRAASALFRFWERRGHFQEGCAWLEEALVASGDKVSLYHGQALNALAFLYWRVGDFQRAERVAVNGLTVNRDAGRPTGVAFALGNLGAIAYLRGDLEVSVAHLKESVAIARAIGYSPLLSVTLTLLARSYMRLAGPSDERPADMLHESLALAEAIDARYALCFAMLTLGDLQWMRGESEGAVALWRRGLTVGLQLADPRGIGALIERLALAAATDGQSHSAAWLFGAADAQLRMVGMELQHDELQHLGFPADKRRTLTEAFEEAWSDGLASCVAEAVDVALQVTAVLRQPVLA